MPASWASLLEACEVLLGRVAMNSPLVVVFDDVQLADADEIELIGAFATSALPASCLIVIGYRTNEGAPEGRVGELLDKLAGSVSVDTIRLGPLDARDVEAWVAAELPSSDDRARREVAALDRRRNRRFSGRNRRNFDALSASSPARRTANVVGVSDVAAAMTLACPYKGLAAYDSDDRGRFLGRDELVDELVAQVQSSGFVAVVGPSGSGKSSVVRAGLLPKFRDGALGGVWDTIVTSPGARPVDALDTALARRGDTTRAVVVFVDQFEECFTICHDADERATFFDALVSRASNEQPVVIALRGDYYGHLAEHPGLSHTVEANTVLVGPIRDADLRAAITGPAAASGLAVEAGLCDVVVGDVAGRSGALPLLSHALLETWRRRRNRTLTLDAYREVGGVTAAIARTADRVFEHLDGHQQEIARRLCLRLTAVGDGAEDTRRRVPAAISPASTPTSQRSTPSSSVRPSSTHYDR